MSAEYGTNVNRRAPPPAGAIGTVRRPILSLACRESTIRLWPRPFSTFAGWGSEDPDDELPHAARPPLASSSASAVAACGRLGTRIAGARLGLRDLRRGGSPPERPQPHVRLRAEVEVQRGDDEEDQRRGRDEPAEDDLGHRARHLVAGHVARD